MNLSKYLVEHNAKTSSNKTLDELKTYNRTLTHTWMGENPDFETEIKAGFHTLTDHTYKEHRTEILNGYSDHYAEKIFGFSATVPDYINRVDEIPFDASQIQEIKDAISEQSAIAFIGHLGGMEFIPVFLALHGIPVTVILRFNSDEARNRAFAQNKRLEGLDIDLIDAGDGLFADLRKLSGQKRLIITVFDGFDNWKPDFDSVTVHWGLKKIRLDSTPRRLHSLLQKGEIFYVSMLRNEDKYRFNSVKLNRTQSHTIGEVVYHPWRESVEASPTQWYIWDEVKEIKNR